MRRVTIAEANLQTTASKQSQKRDLEQIAALSATVLVGIWLLLTTFNAGPLWRDETNSINVAQMPSLKEFWNNLIFESFPPLWLLLFRGLSFLGMAGSDAGIRMIALFVGLAFLGSLWLCARWTTGRPPTIGLALLGSLPAIVWTLSANRAYGLAICLLLLTFGATLRMLESPSRSRIISATIFALLFVHCVYYDLVFLAAILAGAALVVARRREWKLIALLIGIGGVAGLSLTIYLPTIHKTSIYTQLVQVPFFSFSTIWEKFGEAVSLQSSAHWGPSGGPEIWLWLLLFALGLTLAAAGQFSSTSRKFLSRTTQNTDTDTQVAAYNEHAAIQRRADLALFSATVLSCGIAGYLFFLLRLRFPTQPWYYMGLLTLCAGSLGGIFATVWHRSRPGILLRVGFLTAMIIWSLHSMWEETRTRRSNVDVIAAVLENQVAPGDLIIIQSAWEGVTFERYYHGQAAWMTVPPLNSHKVHRTDLMWTELNDPNPMEPVLNRVTDTLRNGGRVWVAGLFPMVNKMPPAPPPPPQLPTKWYLAPYYRYWTAQPSSHLLAVATQSRIMQASLPVPVNARENLPLQQFSGYRTHGTAGKK